MTWLDKWRQWIGSTPQQGYAQICNSDVAVSYTYTPPQSAAALPGNLRRLREAKGMTIPQLAVMASISTSTVRDCETPNDYEQGGKRSDPNPTLVTLLALAKALEVDVNALVAEEGGWRLRNTTITRTLMDQRNQ